MSKYFGLLLLSATLSLSQTYAAGDDVSIQPVEEKIYVARPKCLLKKKAIVVRTKDGIFTAKSLHSDENGFYVKPEELEKTTINPKKGCKPCWKKFKKAQNQQAGNCNKCWKKCQKNNGKQLGKNKDWKANKEATNNNGLQLGKKKNWKANQEETNKKGKRFGKRKHWKAAKETAIKETINTEVTNEETTPVDEVIEIVDEVQTEVIVDDVQTEATEQ